MGAHGTTAQLLRIASDAGLLEEAIKTAAKENAAAADPMDQETPSTDADAAPATTGVEGASDFAPPPGEITKKPVQRLICTDAMAYKADVWKHYAKAGVKFNTKVLEDSGVEGCSFSLLWCVCVLCVSSRSADRTRTGREKAAEKFKTVKYVSLPIWAMVKR